MDALPQTLFRNGYQTSCVLAFYFIWVWRANAEPKLCQVVVWHRLKRRAVTTLILQLNENKQLPMLKYAMNI